MFVPGLGASCSSAGPTYSTARPMSDTPSLRQNPRAYREADHWHHKPERLSEDADTSTSGNTHHVEIEVGNVQGPQHGNDGAQHPLLDVPAPDATSQWVSYIRLCWRKAYRAVWAVLLRVFVLCPRVLRGLVRFLALVIPFAVFVVLYTTSVLGGDAILQRLRLRQVNMALTAFSGFLNWQTKPGNTKCLSSITMMLSGVSVILDIYV